MVTTASRISPLNGLNTTHWYLTGNVTNPVPSRINPFPMFSMPVIATTNPCRPLQECRNFFIMVLKMPFFFTDLLFPGSPNIQAIKYIMNLNSLLLFFSFQKPTQYQILRSFYHQNDPNNNKEKTLTLVQLQLQWINWKKIKKRKHNVEKKHACKFPRHLSWAWRQYSRGGCAQRSEGAIACSSPTLCGKTSFSSLLYYFLLLLLSLELSWPEESWRRQTGPSQSRSVDREKGDL